MNTSVISNFKMRLVMNLVHKSLAFYGQGVIKTLLKPSRYSLVRMNSQSTPKITKNAKHIVWIDLEMTGLDVEKHHILEIACLITDANLNIVATGPNLIIHQDDDVLNNMNDWCNIQHNETGLVKESRESKISVSEAENTILKFVKTYVPEKLCPLGGNSVYMDRIFMSKYMPKLNDYLHYRIVDVSTIKELAKRWFQHEYSRIPTKKMEHRCLSDIKETLEEIKYYKDNIFKTPN